MAEKFDFLEKTIGEKVRHKMLGEGTVISCDFKTGDMVIQFRSNKLKVTFPNSFNDGIISFVVPEKQVEKKTEKKESLYYSDRVEVEVDSWSSDEDEDASWADSTVRKPASIQQGRKTVRSKSKATDNPYDWDERLDRKCDTCQEFKRGDCAGLRNARTCLDYKPIPNITRAEKYNWPT